MDRRRVTLLVGTAAAALALVVVAQASQQTGQETSRQTGRETSQQVRVLATGGPAGGPERHLASTAPRRADSGARGRLEQALVRPATLVEEASGGRGTALRPVSGTATAPTGAEPVHEAQPHSHPVDPKTGGLVSVAGARGVVPDAEDLGPIHDDPLPVGVSLSDPADTASLVERADLDEPVTPGQPFAMGATAPVGTPGVDGLDRHVLPSCSGAGTDGNRVQVVYVHAASTTSRFSLLLPVIRNEVAGVDDVFAVSAEQTGGERRVRWVHNSSCLPVIKNVTVPDGALGSNFWGTVDAMKTLGFDNPHRKYLMFADAQQFCGIGSVYDDARLTGNANDGSYASYARVDTPCWSSQSSVPAHELTHTLGGVLGTAPHATKHGHCYDDSDLMCYDDGSGISMRSVCPSLQEQLLDCHHDDYFSTAPPAGSFLAKNWNTASSSFLDRVLTPGPTRAAAPRASLTAPQAAKAGDTFSISVAAVGQAPFGYVWRAGACTLGTPAAASTTVTCAASTVTQDLAVSVLVTQADGQSVRSTATVHVTGATAPVPAAASWTRPVVTSGVLRSVLRSSTGTPLVGRPTTLQAQWLGHPDWVVVRTVTTGTSGGVTTAVSFSRAGRVRLVSPGDRSYALATSDPVLVKVRTHASMHRRSRHRVTGSLTTLTGRPVPGATLLLQRRTVGSSGWVSVASVRTDRHGVTSSLARPKHPSRFRWVFRGSADHRATHSTPVTVR